MKGYSAFSKAPALLEPHHQIVQCHIQDTHQGGVLPLRRKAVSVFYSPSRLGKALLEPHHQIVQCHIQDTRQGGGVTPLQRSSQCILQPPLTEQSTAGTSPLDCLVSYPGHSLGGVLPLRREAVSVFYSPRRLGKALLEPHHQIVQCHIRTLVGGGLTPLQKSSQCILQPPQLTGQAILGIMCERIRTVEQNYQCQIAILVTSSLFPGKRLIVNRIICV